jgi:hypothetical protein
LTGAIVGDDQNGDPSGHNGQIGEALAQTMPLLTPLGVLVFALSLLLLALLVQLLPLTVLRLVLVTVGGPFRFGLTASRALLDASLLAQGDPSRIFLLAPPPSLPALAA